MTTPFNIHGVEYGNCNCAYGCPCQFNALPTHGDCRFLLFSRIDSGAYGDTSLDGVVFAMFGKFPGAVHEGNGTQQLVIDEGASEEQRAAIRTIIYNEEPYEMKFHWAVYNAMCTTSHEPIQYFDNQNQLSCDMERCFVSNNPKLDFTSIQSKD